MVIDLVFPAFPPALDGIGDYTAHVASALVPKHDVRVITAQPNASDLEHVRVQRGFSMNTPQGVRSIVHAVTAHPPDWVILQYNPFSYGRWGLNPFLPFVMRSIKQRLPRTRLAVMVHEPFVMPENWRFAIMTTWQRWQLWMLGHTADVLFFSIEPWATRFTEWFPNTPVHHLPVSSNMPCVDADASAVRRKLGLRDDALTLGLFGSGHPAHLLPFSCQAVHRLTQANIDVQVLYIGPAGDNVRSHLPDAAVIDAGPLPAEDVSRHFAAMDVYLSPFERGVSTRRGSFMTGIQHGIATATTFGEHTDDMLLPHRNRAFAMTPDDDAHAFANAVLDLATRPSHRAHIARAGQHLFQDTFAWDAIAARMMTHLEQAAYPRMRVSLHRNDTRAPVTSA